MYFQNVGSYLLELKCSLVSFVLSEVHSNVILTVLMRTEIALLHMRDSNREKVVRCQIVSCPFSFTAYRTLHRNAIVLHSDSKLGRQEDFRLQLRHHLCALCLNTIGLPSHCVSGHEMIVTVIGGMLG
jgi:hypothetical protein